jgi:hypothetical protein
MIHAFWRAARRDETLRRLPAPSTGRASRRSRRYATAAGRADLIGIADAAMKSCGRETGCSRTEPFRGVPSKGSTKGVRPWRAGCEVAGHNQSLDREETPEAGPFDEGKIMSRATSMHERTVEDGNRND